MMPLPRPFSVITVTTLGWACLTMLTTGANGSGFVAAGAVVGVVDDPALSVGVVDGALLSAGIGDEAALPTGAVEAPASAAAGPVVAPVVVIQPVTTRPMRASAIRNTGKGCRRMGPNVTPRSGTTQREKAPLPTDRCHWR